MAEFSQIERINIALKQVFGVQGLSNTDDTQGLKWYEETYSWMPFVVNDEVFAEAIPTAANKTAADANVTANPTILEKRDIKLTQVTGTNGRAWAAFQTYNDPNSGFYGDWILPFYWGKGYAMQLYQDNGSGTGVGTEITTTEGVWLSAYKFGFIILGVGYSVTDMSWTAPLWARVYRYIGVKGISGTSANVSLNDAYDIGHYINADENPVIINASNNYASLQITPIAYTPSTGLAAGQICNYGGVLYSYDGTRSKWLSVDQPNISYQIRNGDGNYLASGSHADVDAGFSALRNGTIVGISAAGGSGNQTKSFAIRKNGAAADIATFTLVAGKYTNSAIDIDFSSGDVLQVYCSATGTPIKNPRVNLTIAWRI